MNEVTVEQRKEVAGALSKARWNLVKIFLKFFFGIIALNLTTLLIGYQFLKDCTPQTQSLFHFICGMVNTIFMIHYLNTKLKENSDTLANKIKDILNKQ